MITFFSAILIKTKPFISALATGPILFINTTRSPNLRRQNNRSSNSEKTSVLLHPPMSTMKRKDDQM